MIAKGTRHSDLALVRRQPDGYLQVHHGAVDTLLVIEVTDSSLRFDPEAKSCLYAGRRVRCFCWGTAGRFEAVDDDRPEVFGRHISKYAELIRCYFLEGSCHGYFSFIAICIEITGWALL